MRLSLSEATVFAGVGAVLDDTTGVLDPSNATGLKFTGAELELAIAKEEVTTAPRTWFGLALSTTSVTPVGITGLSLEIVDLHLLFNGAATVAPATSYVVDWTALDAVKFADLDETTSFAVSGKLTLTIDAFVYVTTSFALSAQTGQSLDVFTNGAGAAVPTTVSLLRLSLSEATVFAGVGAVLDDTTGVLATSTATGLKGTWAELELAIGKEEVTTAPRTWFGLEVPT